MAVPYSALYRVNFGYITRFYVVVRTTNDGQGRFTKSQPLQYSGLAELMLGVTNETTPLYGVDTSLCTVIANYPCYLMFERLQTCHIGFEANGRTQNLCWFVTSQFCLFVNTQNAVEIIILLYRIALS